MHTLLPWSIRATGVVCILWALPACLLGQMFLVYAAARCSCQPFWASGVQESQCVELFSHLPEWDKEEPLKTILRFLEAGFSFGRGWRQTPSLGCELMALTEHNRGTCHAHY